GREGGSGGGQVVEGGGWDGLEVDDGEGVLRRSFAGARQLAKCRRPVGRFGKNAGRTDRRRLGHPWQRRRKHGQRPGRRRQSASLTNRKKAREALAARAFFKRSFIVFCFDVTRKHSRRRRQDSARLDPR